MRKYVDVSHYEGITDIKNNMCVMDGKIYNMRVSRYNEFTATIPGVWLMNETPCILANNDFTRLIYSFEDKSTPRGKYNNILWAGEMCTQFTNGRRWFANKGGGYRRFIK